MKISDLDDSSTTSYLKITDFENFFDVHEDKNQKYFYNLNSNLYFDVDKYLLPVYICDHPSHWPLISYKLYGTTRLTWLLWKINDVGPADIFKTKQPGDRIYYLEKQYAESIVTDLNDFDDK